MHESIELDEQHCEALLRAGVFGRVALATERDPLILPVNYAVVDDAVIVRTDPDSALGRRAPGTRLAFEIDHVDYDTWLGWSVVATGTGEIVVEQAELDHIASVWAPRPWASGRKPLHVRLPWDRLTGRQLGEHWDALGSMPVRRTIQARAPR